MSEQEARRKMCMGCPHRFSCVFMVWYNGPKELAWANCGNFVTLKDYDSIDKHKKRL